MIAVIAFVVVVVGCAVAVSLNLEISLQALDCQNCFGSAENGHVLHTVIARLRNVKMERKNGTITKRERLLA